MARGVRIGLVGPLPPPSGGMANQTLQLQSLLAGEGFEVDLIQVNAPYKPAWTSNIKGLRAGFRLVRYLLRLWRAAGRAGLFHVMANSGMSWHLFAAPAIWIARIRGVPVIVNYRGGEADAFFSKSIRWVRPSLDKASAVIVPSGYLLDVFSKWGIRAQIVPNIIDVGMFAAGDDRRRDSRHGPRLLVARNLEPIYDVTSAIRAFSMVKRQAPAAVMTIAGSGPQLDELKMEAARLEVSDAIMFTGRLDNRDMARLYADADVLLNTSLVDNMPISLLEAMAAGVAIVSTNVGGIPYIVQDRESALLVNPGDHGAMANAVLKILGDSQLRTRLAGKAMADVQSYTWPLVRGRLLDVYSKVMDENS